MFSLLYIDDEPGLLELGRLFLENTGEFTVTTALSGDAGLAYLARQDFDAVISDYQMPGMDGISLLKNVRKSFGNIPFILFTGRGREEVVIEAINNGVDFYLQKGGDPKSQFAELAHKVRQAMNRRRAETALSDSEKRLADIINFLPDATFAIDTHGVVIAWNRAMERMTGVRSDEILGKGNYEYALPFYHERRPLLINLVLDDDPAIAEKYPFVKKEGKTLFSEITIPHFNDGMGAALWFTASPLYNRNGEVVGAIESIRDITERKRAEEDLVSANSEYTNLLDQIQDIYYRSDTEGRLVRASRSWATLFGYDDVSECLGRSIADDFYVNPSDRKRLLEEIYRNGKVTGYEALLKKKDGTPVLVEASSHLSFDPAGNIIGIEGIFRDITARKKGEEALNESERRFRELAELLPQGIYEADANGRMQFVNRLALEMSGYTPEDIGKGLNALDVIAPDDRQRAAMVFRQIVEQGTRSQGSAEYTALRKDSTTFPVSILSTAILRGGRIAGVRGVIMDITERKRAEEELRAVNEQLVASQEELRSQYDELAESEKRIRMSETRLTYMLGFYEYSQKSEKELLEYAIEGAGIVTGSPLGYLAFLNEDESQLTMYAWSRTAMAECLMREKPIIYKTEKTGLWGEAVRQRRPVITNDYAAPNPAKKGYPEGHPRIIRHMNVPVLDEGRIVLVAGVANKPSDYTEKDVNELLLLMQGLWTIIKRKRLQEEQKAAYEQISASEEELRQQYGELAATQEDLQRHKVQLDEIAGTLPGVIYQFYARPDGSMGLYYVSSRAADVFGISSNPEDFFERFTQHVDPRDRDAFLQSNVDVARDGLPWHYEGRFIKPSGEEIWFEGISRPIRRGTELVFNGVLLDITGRKRAEEALFNSQQMLQAVLDSIPQRVFWKDRNSVFLGCNKPLALDAGFSEPADMVGKTDYDHASHETAELYRADDRRVMETGQPRINYEEPQIRADGSHAWLRTTKVPLRNKEGTIIGVLGTYEDITEHKRAEEVLRTRSEEYQNILRTAMDGFCIVAMDGSFIDVNDAFCKSLGYTREEVITLSLPRIEVRETPEETARHAQDIIRKGWDRFETRFRQKNGGIIDVEVSIVYTELHGGRFITFSRDITERKKATEELRLLKISADRSSDEVFWMDFTGKILYVNDAACKATGYSRDEFAAMKIFELDPDFPPEVWEASVADLRVRKTQFITTRHQRKDGSIMNVEIVAVYVNQDEREYSFAYVRDITGRKLAEEALRESEEKFRALVETTSDFIWEVDAAGSYTYVSPQVRQILGYEPEELIGRTPFDLMPPDEAERISSVFNRCVTSRLPIVALENKALKKDGSVVILETSGVVRTANDGSYLGYRGIDRDISARKQTTERTARLSALKQDLLRTAPLEEKLKRITDGIVEIFGADFARIWMSGPGDLCEKGCVHAGVPRGPHVCRDRTSCLHLIVSSGRYTSTDGSHRRVPFGAYKIGRIATGEEKQFITNDVTHDPRVHDHAWAESLGLVSFSGFRLVSPEGDPTGVLAFFSRDPVTQDIVNDLDDLATTASQVIQMGMAEEAQREREEWARTILNTAQTGIVLIDAETHRILDANPKALGMIGLPRDSVIDKVCHYFICPAEEGNCPVTDGGLKVDTSERILITATEAMIPVLKTVVPVSLGGKNVLVESFVDISEQKRSEAAIREANRKLNLLSSITRHDVANQLTVIQGYTQLAVLNEPEPVIGDFLTKIGSAIDTIQHQIEFTRTYQDLGVKAPGWFRVGDVVRSVNPGGIKLVCTCNSYEIFADTMISRVFLNLFDNAMKYGERVTTVRVGCAKKGKNLVIRFADNGIGIPSIEKKKIFLKGYGKHTGFGLFLVREILAITGITIQETGIPGKGAVFEMTVPREAYRNVK